MRLDFGRIERNNEIVRWGLSSVTGGGVMDDDPSFIEQVQR